MNAIEAKDRLHSATATISPAVELIRHELPTIEAFLKECRDMDSFGAIIDPTLFNKSERRAVSALLEPVFKAARDLVATYDDQAKRGGAALTELNRPSVAP